MILKSSHKMMTCFALAMVKRWCSSSQNKQIHRLFSVHNLLHGHAAADLGVDSKSSNGDGSRDLVSGGESGRYHDATGLNLSIHASLPVTRGADAAAR